MEYATILFFVRIDSLSYMEIGVGNDLAALKAWLDAYGQAWEGRNPEAAANLYTEDGTYQVTPFLELSNPCVGEKPSLSIGPTWREPKRTFDSDMRSWLQIWKSTLPDGQRRSLLCQQACKPGLARLALLN
jgi:hypothetical protein